MIKKYIKSIVCVCASMLVVSCGEDKGKNAAGGGSAEGVYTLAWSPYTGWEPIAYMQDSGILKKHADKHGITIEVKKFNDYIESINQYTAGAMDAVSLTNMDALTIPAANGIDSTFILPTDFSNGNDAIVSKGANSIAGLKGKTVQLVEMSVSHFVATIKEQQGAEVLFDSSEIPGEIIDTIIVNTAADAKFKQALTDAWYETMAVMAKKDMHAMEVIAASAGGSLEDYNKQLVTTEMFYDKASAKAFFESDDVKKTMDFVGSFSFDKGLYPEGAASKDFIGIEFPDGSVMGDKGNIKLRFDTTFLK